MPKKKVKKVKAKITTRKTAVGDAISAADAKEINAALPSVAKPVTIEEPVVETHSKHSPDGKKSAAEQNVDRCSIEDEIRKYVKRAGGYRKNLLEKDKKRAELLLKKIKRFNTDGSLKIEWDERITPAEFEPKYTKMQISRQP